MNMFTNHVYKWTKRLKHKRRLIEGLSRMMIICTALMTWKGLIFVTKSESPVIVILSGGAGPAFQRGDILFLNNQEDSIRIGELVAFTMKDSDVPIVHRVFKVHEKQDGKVEFLTKGDNNRVDDRGLYAPGQLWLQREDILGIVKGTIRYLGIVVILLSDYFILRYILIGIVSFNSFKRVFM